MMIKLSYKVLVVPEKEGKYTLYFSIAKNFR